MRISDWSSDVCSSDLREPRARDAAGMVEQRIDILRGQFERGRVAEILHPVDQRGDPIDLGDDQRREIGGPFPALEKLRGPADSRQRVLDLVVRKCVVWGKSGSVRVNLGGRGVIK